MVYLIAAIIVFLCIMMWTLGSSALPERVNARDPDRPKEGHLVASGLGIFAMMATVMMLAVVVMAQLAEWNAPLIQRALNG